LISSRVAYQTPSGDVFVAAADAGAYTVTVSVAVTGVPS
jgi:hypothetical protein